MNLKEVALIQQEKTARVTAAEKQIEVVTQNKKSWHTQSMAMHKQEERQKVQGMPCLCSSNIQLKIL